MNLVKRIIQQLIAIIILSNILYANPDTLVIGQEAPKVMLFEYGKNAYFKSKNYIDKKYLIYSFWATWCNPCKILTPILEKLATESKDEWILRKVNIDEHSTIASKFNIMSIPNVKLFINGSVKSEFSGLLPEKDIRQWLKKNLPNQFENQIRKATDFETKGYIEESKKDPLGTVEQNILGNSIILNSCINNNIKRYIFGSTVYVYSNLGSFYRISKQACENYIEHYQQVYNLDYTILRFGSLYGPRSDMRNGIYRFIYQALKNKKIEWNGSKYALREFIHVEDAADCAIKILDLKYINQHLILTGHQSLTINNLFIMIQEILSKENITFDFSETSNNEHYKTTPYIFSPKFGKKLK